MKTEYVVFLLREARLVSLETWKYGLGLCGQERGRCSLELSMKVWAVNTQQCSPSRCTQYLETPP